MGKLAVLTILLLGLIFTNQTMGFYVNSSENRLEIQIKTLNQTLFPKLYPEKVITVVPIKTPAKQLPATVQIQNKSTYEICGECWKKNGILICRLCNSSELSEKLKLNISSRVVQVSTPMTVYSYPKKIIEIKDIRQEQEVSIESPNAGKRDKKPELRVTYRLDINKENRELLLIPSVENIGTGVAKNVKMIIEIPRELRVLSVDNAEYRILGGTVVIEPKIIELKPGQSYETTIHFKLEPKFIEKGKDIQIPLKVGFADEQGNWYWIEIILKIAWAIIQILLEYGLIPGFEALLGILAMIMACVGKLRQKS